MAETIDKDGRQVHAGVAARTGKLLPPPVGTSDWARFSRTSYCVDKTLILKDLIDAESTVVLFTRPRRFGKTTTLKMICAFYEPDTRFSTATPTPASRSTERSTMSDVPFRAEGITDIEKIGLAYFKDKVELCKHLEEAS